MSLTPFIRHELEHQPGTAAAPENSCTRCSPPLGKEPDILLPGDPAAPGTQVPPQIVSVLFHTDLSRSSGKSKLYSTKRHWPKQPARWKPWAAA